MAQTLLGPPRRETGASDAGVAVVTVSPEIQHLLLIAGPVAVAISIIAVIISMRSARNIRLAVVLLTLAAFHTLVTWVLVPIPFGNSACRIPMMGPEVYELISQCEGPIWWVAPFILWLAVVLWLAVRDEA